MPKVKDRHHIKLEMRGRSVSFSRPEYDLSPDEWYRRRTDAFAKLRTFGGIPEEVLKLVEDFEERTPVKLFVYRPNEEVALRFRVKVSRKKKDKTKRLAEMVDVGKRLHDEQKKRGMSAADALAFFLRIEGGAF